MNVSVEIAFSFKHELDETYRCVQLAQGATVQDALNALGKRYHVFCERVFDDSGNVRRNINALVNGENVQFRDGFHTILEHNDRLTVLPPVGGG